MTEKEKAEAYIKALLAELDAQDKCFLRRIAQAAYPRKEEDRLEAVNVEFTD